MNHNHCYLSGYDLKSSCSAGENEGELADLSQADGDDERASPAGAGEETQRDNREDELNTSRRDDIAVIRLDEGGGDTTPTNLQADNADHDGTHCGEL